MQLSELNQLSQQDFVDTLAGVYEHSPWIPEQTWAVRPFASREALHQALQQTLAEASYDDQLALIRAHPELAGKAAEQNQLTQESTHEQASAGLNQCTAAELKEIRQLNAAYGEKFGFPFIMAVKGRSKAEILAAFRQRLNNSPDAEFAEALKQINRIAWLRITDLIEEA